MHESVVVGAMVKEVEAMVADQGAPPRRIRLRTTTAFPAETVRMMFAMHAAGTPLEEVPLEIEVIPLRRSCQCGNEMTVHKYDLTGHLHFCPACHTAVLIEEAHQLECLEIEYQVPEGEAAVTS